MIKQIAILLVVVAAVVFSAPAQEEGPEPYSYSFSEDNENHTISKQESGDASGNVQGTYTFTDKKTGATRTVTYTSDPVNGFNADVKTNEEGVISHEPAAAKYSV